ncbi:hypothetical protein RRG08_006087 [Elysia crispata]|uniref:Uncharacterized protein n=1 Tax=Elysia crispata TaxID=231223 RepID=A0AAE1CSD1_9GAST|nr:hypothetical protein RRG08_006087 [Elysia crispata]
MNVSEVSTLATKQASAALRKPAKKSRKEALAKARASKEAKRLGQVPEPVTASPSTSATPAADPVSAENGIPVKLSASKRKLDLVADFAP